MAHSSVIQGNFRPGELSALPASHATMQAKAPLPFAAQGGTAVAIVQPKVMVPPVRFGGRNPVPAQAKPALATPRKAPMPFTVRLPAPAVQARLAVVQPRVLQLAGGLRAMKVPATLNLANSLGGQALPDPVRQKMESFFDTSFADVRVHVGAQAPWIGALAFTHGSNLYFAPGQYNPNTWHGQRLLGHELTHVVQQRAGRVRNPFGSGVAAVQDLALEAEAERMGQRAASSAMLQMKRSPPSRLQPAAASNSVFVSAQLARPSARPTAPERLRLHPTASKSVQKFRRVDLGMTDPEDLPVGTSYPVEEDYDGLRECYWSCAVDATITVNNPFVFAIALARRSSFPNSGVIWSDRDISRFLTKTTTYVLEAVDTIPPVGDINHMLIRLPDFPDPQNPNNTRTIEWVIAEAKATLPEGAPNAKQAVQSRETRTVSYLRLVKLIRAAVAISGSKTGRNTGVTRGVTIYVPKYNDCFTYVNQVLAKAGEPPSNIHHQASVTLPQYRTAHGDWQAGQHGKGFVSKVFFSGNVPRS